MGCAPHQTRLAAAEAQLTQARLAFERQSTLLAQGHTPRAQFDLAEKALRTAQAQADDAEIQVKLAADRVSFTVLLADAGGAVTARGAKSGEVVQAGQMIVTIARQNGRDAVFDVPAQVLRSAPSGPEVTVRLADDPSVTATGRVREVAPQADPVTRTFEVKVGLSDPPPAMRLGATDHRRGPACVGQGDFNPGIGADEIQQCACSVDRRSAEAHCLAAQHRVAALRSGHSRDRPWVGERGRGGHGGRSGPASGPDGPSAWDRDLVNFNISDWALRHRSFVVYLMIVVILAGAASFRSLGRDEDPAFVIKTMVVQAAWPGATVDDTLRQVTERIERTLQETPHLDFIRSYTNPGLTTIFVNLKGATPARDVPDIWYHVRKSMGDMWHTMPTGRSGPGLQR